MAQFGKEGRDLIRRLYEGLDIDAIKSNNTKKQIRRALGALIFSSDNAGYLDIVENGLTEGLDPVKILGRIRTASERLIESYSPVKGVYEAHHGNPLSALREAYLALSPEEQDRFMDRIEASGWKLGDDPKQLTNTVFTRMSHQRKVPEIKKGDPSGLKSGFQGLEVPRQDLVAHPRGTRDTFLTVKPGEFSTGDALADHFEQVLAPRAMEDLGNAMVQDTPSRLVAAQQGLDLTEVTPENNRALAASEQGALAIRRGTEAVAENYQPTDRGVREILQSAGQDPDVLLTRPTAIEDIGKIITPSLTGFNIEDIQRIAQRTLQVTKNPAVRTGAVIGLSGPLTLGLSAKAHTEATAEAEANPTLRNRAVQVSTGAQVLGDSIDTTGAALTASGIGAPIGIPMMAIGGGISNAGAIAENVIKAPEQYQKSAETVAERAGKTEEEVKSDPLGYGSLFDSVTSKLGEMSLSGYNALQSAFR